VSDVALRFREYLFLERKRSSGELSPAELRRWVALKRLLGRTFSPGVSEEQADRRTSLRVPTKMKVHFASLGELRESLMTNLSRGGLFLATRHLLDIGTRVVLRIDVEEGGRVLEVPAEVVCQNLGPRLARRRGIGLRFLDMDDDTRREIDRLYERRLEAAAVRGR
jgi:uncharacterized protein (TIGR02266 family)